jgi:hypothetical protein
MCSVTGDDRKGNTSLSPVLIHLFPHRLHNMTDAKQDWYKYNEKGRREVKELFIGTCVHSFINHE